MVLFIVILDENQNKDQEENCYRCINLITKNEIWWSIGLEK